MMTDTKTLTCPGPPSHTFEIPRRRGRPPKFCPEHRPLEAPPKRPETDEEFSQLPILDLDDNPFVKKAREREAAEKAKPDPFRHVEPKKPKTDKMAKARQAKEEKKIQRTEEEIERLETEYLEIDDKIEAAGKKYEIILEATKKAQSPDDVKAAFNKADKAQNTVLNLCNRKRALEKLIEEMEEANE